MQKEIKYSQSKDKLVISNLAKEISEIISSEPYSAAVYIKLLQNIIATFTELRLDRLLSRFDTAPLFDLEDYDFKRTIELLNELHKISLQNFERLEEILLELIPSSIEIKYNEYYKKGKYNLDYVLKMIDLDYGIRINKTDLIDYEYMKNAIELPDRVYKKYKDFLSVILTINKAFYLSINPGKIDRDLFEKSFRMILLNNEHKSIPVDNVFFKMEKRNITQLQRILEENGGLIKSFYQSPNREYEIQNIRQYLRTNDLFSLDLIKTDFMLFKGGERIDNDKDTKLEFLKKNSINEPVRITTTYIREYLNRLIKPQEGYLISNITIKLQEVFDRWLSNPNISKWEDYWFNKKMGFVQNELIIAKDFIFEQIKIIKNLESKPDAETDYIPEFADLQDLEPREIFITVNFRKHSQGKELTIEIRDIVIKGGYGLLDFYKKGKKGKTTKNFKYLQCLLDPYQFRDYERADKGSEELLTSRTREFNNLFRRKFPIGKQKVIKKSHGKYPKELFDLELIEP
jgi:hypothetical protein